MMLWKNRNKKVGLCLIVITSCLVVATLWAVLATPETALAKKPGDGGGKGDAAPNCVIFDDGDDSVQSDDGNPYCHNRKANITVKFSQDGHLLLQTNSSAKAGAGRGLYIDFGTGVTLAPGTTNEMTIQTTADALDDPSVLAVSADLSVGGCQDAFNFFNMVEGTPDENVNLSIRVHFSFTDGSSDSLLIRLAPNEIDNGRHCPSSEDVTVTYDGIVNELRQWRVETKALVDNDDDGQADEDPIDGENNDGDSLIDEDPRDDRAGISRSGEGEFGDGNLLFDVNPDDPGHVYLRFGFTVTAAP